MKGCVAVALICLLACSGSATALKQFATIEAAALGVGDGINVIIASLVSSGLLALEETDQQPITFFAPTNQALSYLADVVFNLTLGEALESATLRPYLEYHVVPGIHTASELSNGLVLTTSEGSNITISIKGSTVDVIATENTATITYPNYAEVPNKLIIHVIDTVLLFSDLTNGEVTTEVPVPAPLLDEAFAIAAGYELVPVVAPAASSTRRLLSTQ